MNGDWMRNLVRMIESEMQLRDSSELSGDEVLDEDDLLALMLNPEVGSMALRMAETEIESAVPEKDACYETRIMLIENVIKKWRIDWRAAELAVNALLAIVHAFLRFCTDTSAREHLTKAADIVAEFCSVASERRKNDPLEGNLAFLRRL